MEGHGNFVGQLNKGNVASAKIEALEGARLIEGILLGRKYYDAPIITCRICGICPVVHNLNAIEAMEKALGVKVAPSVLRLRKLMEQAQNIHSHGLHLFFLSAPDFYNIANTLKLVEKFPKQAQAALRLRDFGVQLVRVLGGRTVHPIASVVGGFKVWPKKDELKKLLADSEDRLKDALLLADFFLKLKYPKFSRHTNYVSLYHSKEYGFYQGKIKTSEGQMHSVHEFYKKIREFQRAWSPGIKRVHYTEKAYMIGALARVNNNHKQLNKEAKKVLKKSGLKLPVYNNFYNVLAQSIELVHSVEECEKLLKQTLKNYKEVPLIKVKAKAGKGESAMEAPRGILYDYYELDKEGRIVDCNIITPTAQSLDNLEADLTEYLLDTKKMSAKQREQKIKTLIRAYDPCISCATH